MENKRGQTDVVPSVCLASDAAAGGEDEIWQTLGFPGGSDGKESACRAGDPGWIPGSRRSPGSLRSPAWQPTPQFLPGESHGQRSLVGYNPWGRRESDTTEHLASLSPGLISGPFQLSDIKATLSFKDPGSAWAGCHLRCPAPCIRFQWHISNRKPQPPQPHPFPNLSVMSHAGSNTLSKIPAACGLDNHGVRRALFIWRVLITMITALESGRIKSWRGPGDGSNPLISQSRGQEAASLVSTVIKKRGGLPIPTPGRVMLF